MSRLIYGLVDPREPERVRYVGQTTGLPVSRFLSHIRPSVRDLSRRAHWLREIGSLNLLPDMVLLERVARARDLTERERTWIADLTAIGQADLNAPLPRHWVERRAARGAA